MSNLVKPIVNLEASTHDYEEQFQPKLFNNTRGLKSKGKICKSKFNRELKKKLKKYKLRRDGYEDPEVLDVSEILVTALIIKSPSKQIPVNCVNDPEHDLRPKNYLFKMGRKKQMTKKKKCESSEGNAVVTEVMDTKKVNVIPVTTVNEKIVGDKHEELNGFIEKVDQNDMDTESPKISKNKKQTNAFALMMDSRNKSIGSNSPGKEKSVDDQDMQSTVERKNIKAKRNLILQKMAEAKGSLKKKEMEEYQEMCIKKKMEKRAERLKNMIKNNDFQSVTKADEVISKKESENQKENASILVNNNEDLPLLSQKNNLNLINLIDSPVKDDITPTRKKQSIVKEDDEFLKKLSPSLKKKENMLCYFKKIEKEPEDVFSPQDINEDTEIIKVKLKSIRKEKVKLKKKKLSLNKHTLNEELQCEINDENVILDKKPNNDEITIKKKKDKNFKNIKKDFISKTEDLATATDMDIIRPKRNVKRPAKYIDDIELSSSDEDLHIFTPKKKKQVENQIKPILESKTTIQEPKSKKTKSQIEENKTSQVLNTNINKEILKTKKNTKLAPIFALKPQLDAAAIEAKQKFLSSGVPDKLKKIIEKQTSKSVIENTFHTVVHIQQKQNMCIDTLPKFLNKNYIISQSDSDDEFCEDVHNKFFFKNMIIPEPDPIEGTNLILNRKKTQLLLHNIKQLYPKFPVYRTYRLLRDKNRGEFKDCSYLDLDNSIEVINGIIDVTNESPDKLSWTDKYKAMSGKQIIGNFESIKELRKWLISWTENDFKTKKNNNSDSDSSDFYMSDTDSKDSMKSANNLLVLTGPVGSGKTSLVYAVAAELAIKVLEVNASSKRTGKIMLQDLQEATQSHKVNRGKSSQEIFQNSQEISQSEISKVTKRRGRPKKLDSVTSKKSELKPKKEVLSQPSGSQDSVRTCMSLILVDDADIVFDQDDGFCSAIVQLVQCSKRPVILITSSTSCPHLQRFLQCGKIINTHPLLPRMLGTWLDIMCLVDNGTCWPGLGAKSLDYFNGDIRRTINFLQFQTANDSIQDENVSQAVDDFKASIEDENSNMSWSDREGMDEYTRTDKTIDNCILHFFKNEHINLLSFKYPMNVFNVWWNIPRLLRIPSEFKDKNEIKSSKITTSMERTKLELDVISNVADMISIADVYCHIENNGNEKSDLISLPWATFENHSVSEQESLEIYDKNCEMLHEIAYNLVSGCVTKAQKDLELEVRTDLELPGMAKKRERDRITSRHSNLTSFLNPSALLDRRALALDYWSGCRTICRVEKTRTDCNSKRNNRFCHYLKSANILCKSDSFDNLGNSLYCKEDNK